MKEKMKRRVEIKSESLLVQLSYENLLIKYYLFFLLVVIVWLSVEGEDLNEVEHVVTITCLQANPILALLEVNRLEISVCVRTNLLRGSISEVDGQSS